MNGNWKMRRIAPSEHPQLWHLQVDAINGNYITACGLRFGEAGSSERNRVPGGACAKCLRAQTAKEGKRGV